MWGPELDALTMYHVWGKSTLGHWAGAMARPYCTSAEWVLCSITSTFGHFLLLFVLPSLLMVYL